jgi:redox-sensitive bicupin YhaK (pirin superfamily)
MLHVQVIRQNITQIYLLAAILSATGEKNPNLAWHLNMQGLLNVLDIAREEKLNTFCDITEKLPIKQDARLLSGIFTEDFIFEINNTRKYYLYVVSGELTINNVSVIEGDGLSYIEENQIVINPVIESEVILFDLV